MGSDSTQQDAFLNELEGDSVIVADTQLPNVGSAFHLLYVERRMAGIRHKELKGFTNSFLDVTR